MSDAGVAAALEKAKWQKVLFASRPSRYRLGLLEPSWPLEAVHIQIHRNQPFEFVAALIPAFAAYSNLDVEFTYSEYDDALNFSGLGLADVEILWLDFDRYAKNLTPVELLDWLGGRLEQLRKQSRASILVCNWASTHPDAGIFNKLLDSLLAGIADAFVCDQANIMSNLGSDYFDDRNITLAGSALSNAACMETARMFGLTWLPAVIHPRLKAIVVDLDNTLYAGIVEEDGIARLRLETCYIELQKQLSALQNSGVLLAICSRNNAGTVNRLFRQRKDFPLSLDRFSAVVASWSSKVAGLRDIAGTLSIGMDSILFIDDNPAELAAVAAAFPGIHTLLACADPVNTHDVLTRFPRLHQWQTHREDSLRSADMVANGERYRLRSEMPDSSSYLEALGMELVFHLNPKHLRSRLHELSVKTNQFNTTMLRFSEHEIASRLSDPGCFTIAVELKDRLSESGVIGALFTHTENETVMVDEVCISCRALGREIESIILIESLQKIMHLSALETATIKLTSGPKNAPAIACLDAILQPAIQAGGGCFEYQCGAEQLPDIQTRHCVNVRWES
ncbi:MAG: HAD-IIIC family phosphatase [Thiogranum sp.]